MKKKLAVAIASIGTAFFGILWLNNLVSACRYYVLLLQSDFAGTNRTPSGFWPALDWSTIDLSTVTTFIPFFGFALAVHRLLRPGTDPEAPFFRGYDRFNIALGLLGTIWGIILVGYFPADRVSIGALMRCLHTAMFSTLIAVLWVMVLLPTVVMPLLRFCTGTVSVDETELDQLISRITSGIDAAAAEFTRGTKEAAGFRTELADTAEALRKLREEAAAGREAELAWQRGATEALNAFSEAVRELGFRQRQLQAENEKLAADNTALNRRHGEDESAIRDLKQTVDQIRNALR